MRERGSQIFILVMVGVLSAMASGCSGRTPVRQTLLSAESLMEERPDSALAVLESLPKYRLASYAIKARYSLLYTAALEKNYIDTTDLGVIMPAANYFARHGSPTDRMRAYYYVGSIHSNRGESDEAMRHYLLALEDSTNVPDNRLKGLVNSAISDIFSKGYNSEQELLYTAAALNYVRLAEDEKAIWAVTGHLASTYADLHKWQEADMTYQEFFSMPIYDTLEYCSTSIFYAKDLMRRPEPQAERSITILEEVAGMCPAAMTVEAYCVYAYAMQKIGNSTLADNIINQLDTTGSSEGVVKLWRYRIRREQGQYDLALADLERVEVLENSIISSILKQAQMQSQRDYFQAKSTVLEKENKIAGQRILLIILAALLVSGILAFLYYKKQVAFRKKMTELSSMYRESGHMLELITQKDKELQSQYATMYKEKYKTLNNLCSAYFSPAKKERREIVYNEAMRQINLIVNDRGSQAQFISLVNSSLDNIIDKLRKDLPKRKEPDFVFLTYVIVGFDATTIASLTGYTIDTVYTKKARLKKEITKLSSPYRDFYLTFIK